MVTKKKPADDAEPKKPAKAAKKKADAETVKAEKAAKAAAKVAEKAAAKAARDAEKAAKKAAKKKPAKRSRKKEAAVERFRIYWGVFNHTLKRVALFEFNQRKAAEKRAAELSEGGKPPHFVQKIKEPIDPSATTKAATEKAEDTDE